jgi:hypothetical protein
MLEHETTFTNKKARNSYFKYLLKFTISQTRFSVINNDDNYLIPLHLMLLIVNQIYQDLKLFYESEVVDNLDNLSLIVDIFSSSDYTMTTKGNKKLKQKAKLELVFERRKILRNSNNPKTVLFEKALEKLGLN